jgi:hypothetical protein
MRLRRIGDGDDVSESGEALQLRGCHAAMPMTPAVFAGMASQNKAGEVLRVYAAQVTLDER